MQLHMYDFIYQVDLSSAGQAYYWR